jgi:hypothetical protein
VPADVREAVHRAASDAEMVAWVDEHDQLLGELRRAELRERGLIGRATCILLFNSAGELCVHQRTLSKAIYPGFWDVAAGGMMHRDESYAESAARSWRKNSGSAVCRWRRTSGSFSTSLAIGSGAQCSARYGMARCVCNLKKCCRPASSPSAKPWPIASTLPTAPTRWWRCAVTSPIPCKMAHLNT